MYSGLKYTMIFIGGAAVGIAASWKFFEEKYKKIAQEEIDSVKETWAKKYAKAEEKEPEEEVFDPVVELEAARAITKEYEEAASIYNTMEGGLKSVDEGTIFVIEPEEFGEIDDYETISLTYYSDGVVTDDDNQPIEDVDEIIGEDSLEHFGEYEDDSVFVRNTKRKCDYEILKDYREYSNVKLALLDPEDE
jgi:hypothetical protein